MSIFSFMFLSMVKIYTLKFLYVEFQYLGHVGFVSFVSLFLHMFSNWGCILDIVNETLGPVMFPLRVAFYFQLILK